MILALIGALILVLLGVTFAMQNAQLVDVAFLGWHYSGSLVVVLILTFGVGLIAGYLVAMPAVIRRMSALSACRKRVAELETRQPVREGEGPPPAAG